MARNRGRIRKYTINMEIKITTYVDDEKTLEEKYVGEYISENTYEKIQYIDKNEKKIKIFICDTYPLHCTVCYFNAELYCSWEIDVMASADPFEDFSI